MRARDEALQVPSPGAAFLPNAIQLSLELFGFRVELGQPSMNLVEGIGRLLKQVVTRPARRRHSAQPTTSLSASQHAHRCVSDRPGAANAWSGRNARCPPEAITADAIDPLPTAVPTGRSRWVLQRAQGRAKTGQDASRRRPGRAHRRRPPPMVHTARSMHTPPRLGGRDCSRQDRCQPVGSTYVCCSSSQRPGVSPVAPRVESLDLGAAAIAGRRRRRARCMTAASSSTPDRSLVARAPERAASLPSSALQG